nr:hypothetical protein CFP56_07665 [Quercus suber]
MQQASPSEDTQAVLARLAQRPGVQGTLIISRDNGAIVQSTRLVTEEDVETEEDNTTAATNGVAYTNGVAGNESAEVVKKTGTRKADEIATLVWRYMSSTAALIEDMNGEGDEAKLVRVRTKRNEIVIVPDAKFYLVVLHETPPA